MIATNSPLSLNRIAEIVKIPEEEIHKYIDELNQEYQMTNRAFEIKEVAGGFQIYTLPKFAEFVSALYEKKECLSKAALETLAIVAYHQPITRAEIEKRRGVDSVYILDVLLQKGFIRTCGRVQAPGRPIKYGTTQEFLRYFGINDLSDLPKEEDFGETAIGSPTEKLLETSAPSAQVPEVVENLGEKTEKIDEEKIGTEDDEQGDLFEH